MTVKVWVQERSRQTFEMIWLLFWVHPIASKLHWNCWWNTVKKCTSRNDLTWAVSKTVFTLMLPVENEENPFLCSFGISCLSLNKNAFIQKSQNDMSLMNACSSHLFTDLEATRFNGIEILCTIKKMCYYGNHHQNEGCSTKWNSLTAGHNFKQTAFLFLFLISFLLLSEG